MHFGGGGVEIEEIDANEEIEEKAQIQWGGEVGSDFEEFHAIEEIEEIRIECVSRVGMVRWDGGV